MAHTAGNVTIARLLHDSDVAHLSLRPGRRWKRGRNERQIKLRYRPACADDVHARWVRNDVPLPQLGASGRLLLSACWLLSEPFSTLL